MFNQHFENVDILIVDILTVNILMYTRHKRLLFKATPFKFFYTIMKYKMSQCFEQIIQFSLNWHQGRFIGIVYPPASSLSASSSFFIFMLFVTTCKHQEIYLSHVCMIFTDII